MTNKKETSNTSTCFRQVTERFCSKIGDNVVVMQTVTSDGECYKCMSADGCPNCNNCKNHRTI